MRGILRYTGSLLLFVVGMVIAGSLITNPTNAASTYSYAERGAKIVLNRDGKTHTFNKGPVKVSGKDAYSSVIKIDDGSGGKCNIGLQILVSSGASSGTISAPVFMNGIPVSSAPGTDVVDSCKKDYAAGINEFNKDISISGSTNDDNTAPTPEEWRKDLIVTVYSDKKISELPADIKITRLQGNVPSVKENKTIDWNEPISTGSTRWQNVTADTVWSVCIEPANIFPFEQCQNGTKKYNEDLMFFFGTSDAAYHEDGDKITYLIFMDIPNTPGPRTYGPVPLTLYNVSSGQIVSTTRSISTTIGEQTLVVPEQTIQLGGEPFNGIGPGRYKICVTGKSDICSIEFEKLENRQVRRVELRISADQASQFLDGGTGESGPTTCNVDGGLGWMVCPLLNAAGGLNDLMYGLVEWFLLLNPLQTNDPGTGAETPQYIAWQRIRDIANVLLVIVFVIVIFSQITNIGVTNYGIKKILPRIILVAIAINLSFFIMMITIDLVNIIGKGLHDLLIGLAPDIKSGSIDGTNVGSSWAALVSAIIVGGGITLATFLPIGAGAVAYLLLPFIVVGALSLIAALATLVIRNALIIVLVLIAPIAFAAFLLPNTQSLFDKWRKMLLGMLFLYPTAALLFGGAKFAANIMAVSTEPFTYIVALFVMVAPLGMLPWLAASSGGILATIGNKLQGAAKSAGAPLRNWAGKRGDNARKNYQAGRTNWLGRRRSAADIAARRAQGKRTLGQRRAESDLRRDLDSTNADKQTMENLKDTERRRSIRERARNVAGKGRNAAPNVFDDQRTLSIQESSSNALYDRRADQRRAQVGTIENTAAMQEKVSQGYSERSKKRLDTQYKQAIADNPELQDVVQESKKLDEGMKTLDMEQDAIFEVSKSADSDLVDMSQRQQQATQKISTAKAEEKTEREREADADPTMIDLRQRQEDAEFESSVISGEQKKDLEERKVSDASMQELERRRRASDQAQKTATDEQLKDYGEQVIISGSATQAAASGTVNPAEGQAKAVAYGYDAQSRARADIVSAHTTRFKAENIPDINPDDPSDPMTLNAFARDPSRTPEEREAAGRSIVTNGNIDAIEPYLDYLVENLDSAQSIVSSLPPGDPGLPAAEKRLKDAKDLQKAFAEAIGSSPGRPFGIGSGEIAAMSTGAYSRRTTEKDIPTVIDTSSLRPVELLTLGRIVKKGTSPGTIAGMDKTDIGITDALAKSGKIPAERQREMWGAIDAALSDPRINEKIEPRERALLEDLIKKLAIPVDPSTGGPKSRTPIP